MGPMNTAVDVISVCNADGQIKPLRFRVEDEEQQWLRVDIDEVVSQKEVRYAGAEALVFLCKANIFGRSWLFELKYTFRSHSWCLVRKMNAQ